MDLLTRLASLFKKDSLFTDDRKPKGGIKHPKPCKRPLSPLPTLIGGLCALALLALPATATQAVRPIEPMPAASMTLELADWNVPSSTTEPFWLAPGDPAQALRVAVSPLGGETRAVRITMSFETWVPYAGFENRGVQAFALVQQNATWQTRLSIPPTRRAPFYTDVLSGGVSYNWNDWSVSSFDLNTDYAGSSGAHFVGSCLTSVTVTLRRSEHPIDVARFCVSSPGTPGFVRLDHRCVATSANWYGDVDGTAPWYETSGSGFGHGWAVAARMRTTVAGQVEYLDYEPGAP